MPGQKSNAVALVFYLQNEGPGLKESRFESIWKAPRLIQGMPIKMPVVHLGSTSTLWSPAHSVLKVALNVIAGMRLNPHYGEFAFGIDCCLDTQYNNLTPRFFAQALSMNVFKN